jgi:hypothetical protein
LGFIAAHMDCNWFLVATVELFGVPVTIYVDLNKGLDQDIFDPENEPEHPEGCDILFGPHPTLGRADVYVAVDHLFGFEGNSFHVRIGVNGLGEQDQRQIPVQFELTPKSPNPAIFNTDYTITLSQALQLHPSADATILSNLPDLNIGTGPLGTSSNLTSEFPSESMSWLKFSLAPLQFDTGVVDRAILSLSFVAGVLTDQGGSFRLYRVTQDWQESLVTYNNQPAAVPTSSVAHVITTPLLGGLPVPGLEAFVGAGKIQWDITSLVREWKANPTSNFGIMIRGDGAAVFQSREGLLPPTLALHTTTSFLEQPNGMVALSKTNLFQDLTIHATADGLNELDEQLELHVFPAATLPERVEVADTNLPLKILFLTDLPEATLVTYQFDRGSQADSVGFTSSATLVREGLVATQFFSSEETLLNHALHANGFALTAPPNGQPRPKAKTLRPSFWQQQARPWQIPCTCWRPWLPLVTLPSSSS